MITYKAIVEKTDNVFESTRKSDIKKWAKEELKKGVGDIDVYACYQSPCADEFGEDTFSYVGTFYKDGEITFK